MGISRLLQLLMFATVVMIAPEAVAEKAAEPAERETEVAERTTWYASTVANNEEDILVVNYWSKGTLFRAETVMSGHRIATVVNGGTYYIFDEVAGTGVAIERSERALAEDAARERPFGNDFVDIIEGGGELIRSGVIEGPAVE
jgi:hypothetical protein